MADTVPLEGLSLDEIRILQLISEMDENDEIFSAAEMSAATSIPEARVSAILLILIQRGLVVVEERSLH